MQMLKLCTGNCKEIKLLELFGNTKRTKDGKQNWCKICVSRYDKQYRAKNKDSKAAYGKKYRAENKGLIRSQQKDYYEQNSDYLIEKQRQYRLDNPEYNGQYNAAHKDNISKQRKEYYKKNADKLKANSMEYFIKNADTIRVKRKMYYVENREKLIEYTKQWCLDNPGKANARNAKRRAAQLQRTPSWADHDAIKQVYTDCVEINLAAATAGCTERFSVDHIIPLVGKLVSGFHIGSNLQIITAKENSEKNNKFTPGNHA